MRNFFRALIGKQSPSRQSMAMIESGPARHMERNYQSFAKEGYQNLVAAYRSVNYISDAVAGVKLVLKSGEDEVESHEAIDLLMRPNPLQGYHAFCKAIISYLMISGNTFIKGVSADREGLGVPKELWPMRPDRFSVKPGKFGLPSAYVYRYPGSSTEIHYTVDIMGRSQVLHMKLFHPDNDIWGLSPMEPAAVEIDSVNAASRWNLSLLQNSARPAGVFMYKGTGDLDPEQRQRLKEDIERIYSGARNAGKVMVMGGGFDYKELGFNPKDMDFLNSKKTNEKDVALAFGVPGQLIGIEGSQTFANYEQAKLSFYTDTVVPITELYVTHLNNWLLKAFDPSGKLRFEINHDSILALEPLRKIQWDKAIRADWLTPNEKRQLTGYAPYDPTDDPADKLYMQASEIPIGEDLEFDNLDIDDDDDEDDDIDSDDGKSFKVLNVTSKRGKRQVWREQNRKRDKLEKRMAAQLRAAFKKEQKLIINALKDADKGVIELIINDAIDENTQSFKSIYEKNLKRAMSVFGKQIIKERRKSELKAPDDTFDASVRAFIQEQVAEKITGIAKNSKKRVIKAVREIILEAEVEGLTEVDVSPAIMLEYEKFSEARSRVIARTEIHNASLQGSKKAAEALQIPNLKKEWIATLDARVRDSHASMNGVKVGLDESFEVASDKGVVLMDGPGDQDAPAREVVNCRCVLVYSEE